ncbi:hypothetical protein GOBAR_DD21532 [Gossypium barbadense]|nr:hypothetical protein GOBAR_DD21532 [Gossypium barbadense]
MRSKSRHHPTAPTSGVKDKPTTSIEIELALRCETRRHPPAPTSSVEVEPTAGVSRLAPRYGSRRCQAWNRIDMVSTMYVPEAKLDSHLLAPLRHLHSMDEQHLHNVKRYHGT